MIEGVALVPAADRASSERQVGAADDSLRVEELNDAEAVALRAGAHRAVEGKEPWLEFLDRVRTDGTGESGRKIVLALAVHFAGDGAAIGAAQRGFEGFGEALADVFAHLQPVDDDIDRMLLRAGEPGEGIDLVNLSVHAQPDESLRAQFGEQLALLALAVGDHRREDHQPAAFRQRKDVVYHLRDGLCCERQPMFGAVRSAGAGEKQAQVVVNLGDRADGRTGVVAGRLLFDRNRRRESLDQVDVGFLHSLQELSGVRRQRLDVAPLPLGVERVEGERGLAGTRQPGDDDQSVARQVEADVLQVVRACPTNSELAVGVAGVVHRGAGLRRRGKPANIRNSAVRQQTPCPPRAQTA